MAGNYPYGKGSSSTVHGFQKIDQDMKAGTLSNLILLYGCESFLIRWAEDALKKMYLNQGTSTFDLTKLEGETTTVSEIIACCETLPMLSEKRVVILDQFRAMEGSSVKGFGENDEKRLAEYFSNIPESCLLIVTCEQPDKRKKLYKGLMKHGVAYDFEQLDERQLRSFISKRLKVSQKQIESDVIPTLVSVSGYYDKDTTYTLDHLVNDVEKIIAHSSPHRITAKDVTETITGNLDSNVFALIDALSNNKKGRAFQMINNTLSQGEKEHRLLALICAQFETMLMVKEMKEDGMALSQIKSQLGIHEFRIKKASEFAVKYSISKLRQIVIAAYEVDKNIKTGLLEPRLALEMFVAAV